MSDTNKNINLEDLRRIFAEISAQQSTKIGNDIQNQFEIIDYKLDAIEKQTTRTNGRVTDVEKQTIQTNDKVKDIERDIENMKGKNNIHFVSCPNTSKIEKLNKYIRKYPRADDMIELKKRVNQSKIINKFLTKFLWAIGIIASIIYGLIRLFVEGGGD